VADGYRVYKALCDLIEEIDSMIGGATSGETVEALATVRSRLKEVLKLL
jgi:hypothetical protein